MVTMLATLDFNLAKDANGKDITFEAKYINGPTRCVVALIDSHSPLSL